MPDAGVRSSHRVPKLIIMVDYIMIIINFKTTEEKLSGVETILFSLVMNHKPNFIYKIHTENNIYEYD